MSKIPTKKFIANLFLFLLSYCILDSALAQIDIDLAKATINNVYLCELKLEDTISLLGEATSVTNRNSILVNEYAPTQAYYANEGLNFMFHPPYYTDNEQSLLYVTISLTDNTVNKINKTNAFSGKLWPKVNLSWSILESKHWLENNFSSGSEITITSAEEMKELYTDLPELHQVLYFRNQIYYHGVTQEFDSHSLSLAHREHSKTLEMIVIGCDP